MRVKIRFSDGSPPLCVRCHVVSVFSEATEPRSARHEEFLSSACCFTHQVWKQLVVCCSIQVQTRGRWKDWQGMSAQLHCMLAFRKCHTHTLTEKLQEILLNSEFTHKTFFCMLSICFLVALDCTQSFLHFNSTGALTGESHTHTWLFIHTAGDICYATSSHTPIQRELNHLPQDWIRIHVNRTTLFWCLYETQ